MGKRKKIPKVVKDIVWERQNGKCAVCMDYGRERHHIDPVALNGKNSVRNLILLCSKHHKMLHLADPDVCMSVFEYAYYLQKGKLPDDPYSLITAREVIETIKNDYIGEVDYV